MEKFHSPKRTFSYFSIMSSTKLKPLKILATSFAFMSNARALVLLITSQEYFRFIKNSDAKVIEKMYEKVDENIKKNQIEFQNPSEGLIYSLKYLRKMLRADL